MDNLYDPRSVANLILEFRKLIGLPTTNLEIQKISFFCYSAFLISHRQRLMKGFFEAWDYGPVHPILYRSFKEYNRRDIESPALARDPFTGEVRTLPPVDSVEARRAISETVSRFSSFSAGELVDYSHRIGGPWDAALKEHEGKGTLGKRITDEIILRCSRSGPRAIDKDDAAELQRFANDEDVRFYVEQPFATNRSS